MKKLFISQPMRDKTDEEIKAERERIVKAVTERFGEVEVIDSFFESAPHDARPLWFLGKSLELLSTADCAYFAEGWKDYRGCKIEHECAVQYGIDIVGESNVKDLNIQTFTFGEAIRRLKAGKKVARKGWNGKGMFVVYQKGYPNGIPCNKQTAEAWGINEGDLFVCNPYFQIRCVDGSHSMWVPSINDCLAEDWVVVE